MRISGTEPSSVILSQTCSIIHSAKMRFRNVSLRMQHIFHVIVNEIARYKGKELEFIFIIIIIVRNNHRNIPNGHRQYVIGFEDTICFTKTMKCNPKK